LVKLGKARLGKIRFGCIIIFYLPRFKHIPKTITKLLVSSNRTHGQSLLHGDILQRKIIYDAYEEDFAKIQVFFKQPVMFNIESKPVLTWLDYFSGLGGIMGLVLGMGIISLFEAIWLSWRILRHLFVISFEIVDC
jgi:hypothetical protein